MSNLEVQKDNRQEKESMSRIVGQSSSGQSEDVMGKKLCVEMQSSRLIDDEEIIPTRKYALQLNHHHYFKKSDFSSPPPPLKSRKNKKKEKKIRGRHNLKDLFVSTPPSFQSDGDIIIINR
ncbi:hypothetical protein ACFE04_029823 [Oxalis oulophora]